MSGTLPIWPTSLGCPLRASYAGQADAEFSTTEVADGPPRHRLLTSDARRRWSLEFLFDAAQMATFEAWVASDLNLGLSWFVMPQLTGFGMTDHYCHFVGDYQIAGESDSATHLRVAFEVEAYTRWPDAPAPLEFLATFDARRVTEPLPTDIVDARSVAETQPGDVIDSLVPGA